MSDHQGDPCLQERGLESQTNKNMRGQHGGYGVRIPQDIRRASGPPSVSSEELYRANYGHPASPAPNWTRVPTGDDHYLSGGGFSWVSRGVDSPLPSGHDYYFEPALESKYECPICLMCLRDPLQTECGHRFCSECIRQCLRDAGLRCPVDNVPLTENQMFPDVCVKREIMDLRAHCPYEGCPELVELRDIENHKETCIFRTDPCPNRCGAFMRRKSVDDHLDKECPKRPVKCNFCGIVLPFDLRDSHMVECPKRSVACEFCQQSILQENLQSHHRRGCSAIPVACQYAAFGCQERLPKDKMADHISCSTVMHLELLGSHVQNLTLSSQGTGRMMNSEFQDQAWWTGATYNGRNEYATAASKIADIQEYGAKKLDPEKFGRTQMGKGSQMATSPTPMLSYGSVGSLTYVDVAEQIMALKDKVRDLQEKEVLMRQKVIELESKSRIKDAEIKSLRSKVDYFQKEARDLREHVANGIFTWRLHGYTGLRMAADRGESTVRHSDGFYTSSCGYRLCIRVNISKSDTRGMTFISLFVHFMQGKYDDFLDWPFRGSIKLSIIDQTEDPMKRKHISETLLAKSLLDAFKRPKTVRNHKGFGYMEFASVDSLERDGSYIKDEMILIKVEVHPQS